MAGTGFLPDLVPPGSAPIAPRTPLAPPTKQASAQSSKVRSPQQRKAIMAKRSAGKAR